MGKKPNYKVKHIYIGKDDIQEWTQGVGKSTLMPLMLIGIKKLIKNNLKKFQFARVECLIREEKKAFDFWINKKYIQDSLQKCLEWAIEEEEYEMCSEIKKLEKELDKENEF